MKYTKTLVLMKNLIRIEQRENEGKLHMCTLYNPHTEEWAWRHTFQKKPNYGTECPKSYRKSVLHLLKYTANLYLSRCSTDLR